MLNFSVSYQTTVLNDFTVYGIDLLQYSRSINPPSGLYCRCESWKTCTWQKLKITGSFLSKWKVRNYYSQKIWISDFFILNFTVFFAVLGSLNESKITIILYLFFKKNLQKHFSRWCRRLFLYKHVIKYTEKLVFYHLQHTEGQNLKGEGKNGKHKKKQPLTGMYVPKATFFKFQNFKAEWLRQHHP